jgi:uncharacterized protein (TIGR02611 family)
MMGGDKTVGPTEGRRLLRKIATGVVGLAVILLGAVMIFLPAPGGLTIALGVAILAREFAWAERSMMWMRALGRTLVAHARALALPFRALHVPPGRSPGRAQLVIPILPRT